MGYVTYSIHVTVSRRYALSRVAALCLLMPLRCVYSYRCAVSTRVAALYLSLLELLLISQTPLSSSDGQNRTGRPSLSLQSSGYGHIVCERVYPLTIRAIDLVRSASSRRS